MSYPQKSLKVTTQHTAAKQQVKKKLVVEQGHALRAEKLIHVDTISETITRLLSDLEDLNVIHQKLGADKFYFIMLENSMSEFLLERLSIFAEQYPTLFQQTIFCGWLSLLIARELELDAQTAKNVFIASMARDIGLLYLPVKLLDDTAAFDANDWNAMRTHPLIGEIMLRDVAKYPEEICLAVRDHHERFDGSGYPQSKKGNDISVTGQIIGIADTVTAIRFKKFGRSGRNLRDTFHFILMGKNSFNTDVTKALTNILTKSGIKKSTINPFDTLNQLISHLYVRAAAMNGSIYMLEKLPDLLVFFDKGPKKKELGLAVKKIQTIIDQSGILDEAMLSWLNNMEKNFDENKVNLEELSEMELLQNELYWHLKRIYDLLLSFHDFEMNKANRTAPAISTILKCLSDNNLPKTAKYPNMN